MREMRTAHCKELYNVSINEGLELPVNSIYEYLHLIGLHVPTTSGI